MLTLTENEMRLTAAGQAPCEEYVTSKSAVTKEEKPKTRSRVVLKHQVQKIETSKPESKANITQNIDSESKTEDEKSEQTAGVVKGFSKCVVALRATASGKDDSKQPTTFGVAEAAVVKKLDPMPAVAKKVAPMSPTKSGEAKPAVGEKLAQKGAAKSGEAKPAVGEIVDPKPPAKSGEAKPDVADEHASELASVIDANEPSVAALFSKSGPVRSSTICGASRPAEPLQQPTAS